MSSVFGSFVILPTALSFENAMFCVKLSKNE